MWTTLGAAAVVDNLRTTPPAVHMSTAQKGVLPISGSSLINRRRPLTIQRIQQTVADYYNLSTDDMKSKRRDKHIVFPRQVAMYLVREETPSSLPVIGQAFGGRDHTTALHSIDKIANELKEDERLRYDLQVLRERIYAE